VLRAQGAGAEVAADGSTSTSTSPVEDDGGTLDDLGQGQRQGHHEEDNDDDHHFSSSSSTGNKHKQTSCLLPARSLRSTDEASHSQQADCGVRSLSFSKILSFRMWAPGGSSSPTCLEDYIAGQHQLEHDDDEADKLMKQVCRSQSVPATSVARRRSSGTTAKGKGSRRVADSSSLRRLRVVPLRVPLPPPPPLQDEAARGTADAIATTVTTGEEEEDQDIAAEEAVCRICMVALSEEAVFKLECCCKGELALAHRACAIKWFSIKGNGSCDVCSQEVLNLPVTLRRLPDHPSVIQAAAALAQAQAQAQAQGTQADGGGGDPTATTNTTRYRVWHGTPILIIVSMLAYFCFLEQLLVSCLLHSSLLVLPPSWNGMEQLLIRMNEHGNAGRRPWHGGSGHLLALRLRPWPLLLPIHNKDGVQEIRMDLLCSAVPLHRALHAHLLQIRKSMRHPSISISTTTTTYCLHVCGV
jgi:hypothetical protein